MKLHICLFDWYAVGVSALRYESSQKLNFLVFTEVILTHILSDYYSLNNLFTIHFYGVVFPICSSK